MADTDDKAVAKLTEKLKKAEAAADKQKSADAAKIKDLQGKLKTTDEKARALNKDNSDLVDMNTGMEADLAEMRSALETLQDSDDLAEALKTSEERRRGLETINIELGEEYEALREHVADLEGRITEMGGHVDSEDDHEAKVEHLASCKEWQSESKAKAHRLEKSLKKFDQDASRDTGSVPNTVMDSDRRRKMVREVNESGDILVKAKREVALAGNALNPDAKK